MNCIVFICPCVCVSVHEIVLYMYALQNQKLWYILVYVARCLSFSKMICHECIIFGWGGVCICMLLSMFYEWKRGTMIKWFNKMLLNIRHHDASNHWEIQFNSIFQSIYTYNISQQWNDDQVGYSLKCSHPLEIHHFTLPIFLIVIHFFFYMYIRIYTRMRYQNTHRQTYIYIFYSICHKIKPLSPEMMDFIDAIQQFHFILLRMIYLIIGLFEIKPASFCSVAIYMCGMAWHGCSVSIYIIQYAHISVYMYIESREPLWRQTLTATTLRRFTYNQIMIEYKFISVQYCYYFLIIFFALLPIFPVVVVACLNISRMSFVLFLSSSHPFFPSFVLYWCNSYILYSFVSHLFLFFNYILGGLIYRHCLMPITVLAWVINCTYCVHVG